MKLSSGDCLTGAHHPSLLHLLIPRQERAPDSEKTQCPPSISTDGSLCPKSTQRAAGEGVPSLHLAPLAFHHDLGKKPQFSVLVFPAGNKESCSQP